MPENMEAATVRSLAGIQPGESVEIRLILFDSLRTLCRDLGLREGMVVYCRGEARLHLILRTARQTTIVLERDWARFIQVIDLAPRAAPAQPLAEGGAAEAHLHGRSSPAHASVARDTGRG